MRHNAHIGSKHYAALTGFIHIHARLQVPATPEANAGPHMFSKRECLKKRTGLYATCCSPSTRCSPCSPKRNR